MAEPSRAAATWDTDKKQFFDMNSKISRDAERETMKWIRNKQKQEAQA